MSIHARALAPLFLAGILLSVSAHAQEPDFAPAPQPAPSPQAQEAEPDAAILPTPTAQAQEAEPAPTLRPAPTDSAAPHSATATPGPSFDPHVFDLRNGYDARIHGVDEQDELGIGLASGDWNGDGLDDLAIGAWFGDSYGNERPNAGEVYILFGRKITHRSGAGRAGTRLVYGAREGDRVGTAFTSGDWDGDGAADLAIAARFAGTIEDTLPRRGGQVILLFGGAPAESGREIVDLSREADVVIYGAEEGDRLGRALLLADLDGDGLDDLLAAAVDGDGPKNAHRDCGEVYCVWGDRLASGRKEIDLLETSMWSIDGVDPNDGMGRSIEAGDVDGDGRVDVVLAATFADGSENARTNAGDTYVLFGGTREELVAKTHLSRHADAILFGADSYEYSGASIAVADLDGDGIAEIAIGANLADEPQTKRDMCGAVYVIKGRPREAWKKRYDLGREADLTLYGQKKGEQIGLALVALRQQEEALFDLAVGANLAGAGEPPRERAGKVFVRRGRRDLFAEPAARLVLDEVAERIIDGAGAKDQAGFALGRVAWGAGGRDGLVIGAPFADGPRDGRSDAGEVYILTSEITTQSVPPSP